MSGLPEPGQKTTAWMRQCIVRVTRLRSSTRSGSSSPAIEVRRLVDRAYRRHRARYPARAGVSDAHSGPTSFREAAREAAEALRLGRELSPSRNVTYFYDLGVHRLLLGLRAPDPLHAFHDHLLGRLHAYDREKNADLVATWRHGPRTERQRRRQAAELHRNTLNYRIRRIGEITGFDSRTGNAFRFEMALKIRETLNNVKG